MLNQGDKVSYDDDYDDRKGKARAANVTVLESSGGGGGHALSQLGRAGRRGNAEPGISISVLRWAAHGVALPAPDSAWAPSKTPGGRAARLARCGPAPPVVACRSCVRAARRAVPRPSPRRRILQ